VFVIPQRGSLTFNQIVQTRPGAVTGDIAVTAALNVLKNQKAQTSVRDQVIELYKGSAPKITYAAGYSAPPEPPAAPAAAAQPAAAAPAAADASCRRACQEVAAPRAQEEAGVRRGAGFCISGTPFACPEAPASRAWPRPARRQVRAAARALPGCCTACCCAQ